MTEAAGWYESQRPGLGHELLDHLLQCFRSIAIQPLINPVVYGEIRRALTRKFPYRVYYVLREDQTIVILAVRHFRRDDEGYAEALL